MSSKAMGFIEFLSDVRYQILKQRADLLSTGSTVENKCLKDKSPLEGTCH